MSTQITEVTILTPVDAATRSIALGQVFELFHQVKGYKNIRAFVNDVFVNGIEIEGVFYNLGKPGDYFDNWDLMLSKYGH